MNNSRALLTEDAIEQLALEYVYKNGSYKPLTLYENNVVPAVSVITTPEDMGRFIIAHNKEARKQANLLFEATDKPIYDTQFSYDTHIPGYAYTFHEKLHGGHRFLEHSGDAAADS
jgi:hypothetical protein